MNVEVLKWARKQLPLFLTREEKINLVLIQTKLRNVDQKDHENVEWNRKKRASQVSSRTAYVSGLEEVLVKSARAKWIAGCKVLAAVTPENSTAHKTIIYELTELMRKLQEFVRLWRSQR